MDDAVELMDKLEPYAREGFGKLVALQHFYAVAGLIAICMGMIVAVLAWRWGLKHVRADEDEIWWLPVVLSIVSILLMTAALIFEVLPRLMSPEAMALRSIL